MFKMLIQKRPFYGDVIEKNLLNLKSLNVFNYVFKLDGLFPPMVRANLQVLTNTKMFPVNCAVDDFDLNYSNDQVELFDFFHNQNAENHYSESNHQYPSVQTMNIPHVKHEDAGYIKQEETNEFGTLDFDIPNDFNFKFQEAQPGQVNQSHFNLNMIGVNHMTYFNDFKPGMGTHTDSTYSSSVESYISPLDDEFFKKSVIKKRQHSHDVDELNTMFELESRDSFSTSVSMGSVSYTTPPTLATPKGSISGAPPSAEGVSKKRKSKSQHPMIVKKPKDDSMKFECDYCDAKFKVKGYLTRHIKKHNSSKAFKCPFYHDEGEVGAATGTKCHPTGGFSRRDTYKTHLKALHFIYPPGTKSSERLQISGRCAGCFQFFENNVQWLEQHIETGKCNGIVASKYGDMREVGSKEQ